MCGRAASFYQELDDFLDERDRALEAQDNYNIPPSAMMPVIVNEDGKRKLKSMQWWLIPQWAKSTKMEYKTFNARTESAHEKPSFRQAYRQRRCLVPVSGYYEWKGVKGSKQPYFIHKPGGGPMCFAGLWERWQKGDEPELFSFTIITTPAADKMKGLHPRMPVWLEPEHHENWLNPESADVDTVRSILTQASDDFEYYPVSTYINSSSNNGSRCIERFE